MIYKVITNDYEFAEWLKQSNSYKNNFSFKGANALQAYIEELSNDATDELYMGEEFDPVAWCCEWSEYKTAVDMIKDTGYNEDTDIADYKDEKLALEWLQNRTTVIKFDGGIIVRDF